ncbi:MAG: sulfurtransferase TusA family protein [gamma proteobacterium symbiont of Bathyaustriella thionipta]|nr:sulfurtransferase TusA family protein [gamma proteobacterium symbiont of Bathyaustriella thionipta]MCU7951185.1 sulfurtransferase TusA family protein [gamma proteobacterium symbiont of Bathyaustriella thionipta]MCU7953180.1 sulfurtransferase TusA family protein [gamma proteobacterium symbiont of Bathyaustriella thionipta]MCU7957693.1 sulfurtransferase TusA family protein [gamma proteobacterium symbiont of Bathyaustriella thionipta]MCU7967203.1 sulfurtransferase TusA family protein [gamma pro
MTPSINATLDARGLSCPLPILKTKKALAQLNKGEMLEPITSAPGSVKDLSSFCEQTGHELISSEVNKDEFIFIVKKYS